MTRAPRQRKLDDDHIFPAYVEVVELSMPPPAATPGIALWPRAARRTQGDGRTALVLTACLDVAPAAGRCRTWDARNQAVLNSAAWLITQRSQVHAPATRKLQVRGPIAGNGGRALIFVAAGWQQDLAELSRAQAGRNTGHWQRTAAVAWLEETVVAAGLVDELTIIIAPVTLGAGRRIFKGFGESPGLEQLGVRQSPFATFIDYCVRCEGRES